MKYISEEIENYMVPENLKQFILFWQGQLDDLPDESKDSATVEISADTDGYDRCFLNYSRKKTLSEVEQEKVVAARIKKDRQAFVKSQIERLQKELD